MNGWLAVGGSILLMIGLTLTLHGVGTMRASTFRSFQGIKHTDADSYDLGFTEILVGVGLAILGAFLLILGLLLGSGQGD